VPALATLATLGSFQKWKYTNSWMVYDGKYINILLNILFKWINNKKLYDLGVPRWNKKNTYTTTLGTPISHGDLDQNYQATC